MSTRIAQHTLVQCPPGQAEHRLSDFFRANGNHDGEAASLPLSIDASIPGLPRPLRLERAVVVTLRRVLRSGDATPRYAVAWAPAEPGPFPLFAGELRVEDVAQYDAFSLVIEGSYEPPFGLAGAAFDVIIGARIASLCVRNLLAHIANFIEGAFASDEAQKATVPASSR